MKERFAYYVNVLVFYSRSNRIMYIFVFSIDGLILRQLSTIMTCQVLA